MKDIIRSRLFPAIILNTIQSLYSIMSKHTSLFLFDCKNHRWIMVIETLTSFWLHLLFLDSTMSKVRLYLLTLKSPALKNTHASLRSKSKYRSMDRSGGRQKHLLTHYRRHIDAYVAFDTISWDSTDFFVQRWCIYLLW